MINIKEGARRFINGEHKRLKSVLAGVLACAVMTSVAGSLIRPAISATQDDVGINRAVRNVYEGSAPYPSELAAAALEIKNSDISSVTGIYDVSASINSDKPGTPVEYYTNLILSYNLAAADVKKIKEDHGNCIKFNLDMKSKDGEGGIQIFEGMALDGDVKAGNTNNVIGHYYIDPDTKEVLIEFDFTTEYLISKEGSAIDGSFKVESWVWDNNNKQEDKEFSIAGKDVTVPIYRYTHKPDLELAKVYNNDFFQGTQGETMKGKASLGSSFKISIKSENGVDETRIDIVDTLVSEGVRFDVSENYQITLYDKDGNAVSDPKLVIDNVDGEETEEQTLNAHLETSDKNLLKNGFEYYFDCPVVVKSAHIKDGKVSTEGGFNDISGKNTVEAETKTVEAEPKSDKIHVNLLADIAKDNGVYNPDDDTITWTYGIYKNNGWWQNGEIKIDDLFGSLDDNGKVPELVGEPELEVSTGTSYDETVETDHSNIEKLVFEKADVAKNGVYPLKYDHETGRYTINMELDDDPNSLWYNQSNKKPVIAFKVSYKTKVNAEDYGKVTTNWVGLRDPSEGEDSPNKYNWRDNGSTPIPTPTVDKSGSLEDDGIVWTISINNAAKQNLSGMSLNDILSTSSGTFEDVVFTDAKVNGNELTSVFESDSNPLVFKEGNNGEKYVITYKQALTKEQMTAARGKSFTNKVTLKKEDVELDDGTDTVSIPKQFEVIKEGELNADGEMIYTVTFVNQYDENLKNSSITDTLTIYDKNNQPVSPSNYTIEKLSPSDSDVGMATAVDGNSRVTTFTVNKDTTEKRVVVTYKVKPTGNSSFKDQIGYKLQNTANWQNYDQKTVNKTIEKFVNISDKQYSYNRKKNTITWRVTVNNPYELDLGEYPNSENPYKLYDTMFGIPSGEGTVVSLTVKDADGNIVDTDAGALNKSERETINNNEYGSYIFKNGMKSKSYTFEYETEAPDKPSFNVRNTVSYDDDTKTVEATEGNNHQYNSLSKNNVSNSSIKDDGTTVISWKVEVKSFDGGFLKKVISDDMTSRVNLKDEATASVKDTSSVEHYLTPEQFNINKFYIKAYKGNDEWASSWTELNAVSDYTELFELEKTSGTDDKITGFKIKPKSFDEGSNEYNALKEINKLEITYSTTGAGADILNKQLTDNDEIIYTNTVETKSNGPQKADKVFEKKPAITKYIQIKDQYNNLVYINDEKSLYLSELSSASDSIKYTLQESDKHDGSYYLSYKLEINKFNNYTETQDIIITDLIPNHTNLVLSSLNCNNKNVGTTEGEENAFYSLEGRELKVTIPAAVHKGEKVDVTYVLEITKSEMDAAFSESLGNALFSNTATTNNGESDNIGTTIVDDKEIISKTAEYNNNNNVKYTLVINPNKRKLLTGNLTTLVVKDKINLSDDGNYALLPIEFNQINLSNIKVKIDGEDADISELGFSAPEKKSLPVLNGPDLGKGDVYIFEVEIPDEKKIEISYDYSFDFNAEAVNKQYYKEKVSLKNAAVIDGKNAKAEKDVNENFEKGQSSSATATAMPKIQLRKTSTGQWHSGLPNAEFELKRIKQGGTWEYLTGSNTVDKLYVPYESDGITKYKELEENVDFGAWNSTSNGFTLKTNENGVVFLPNLQDHKIVDDNGNNLEVYLEDSGAKEQKYLYVLSEVKTPAGYRYNGNSNEYYFFEQPLIYSYDQSYPKGAISTANLSADTEIHAVRPDEKIELKNDAIELDVHKTWSGDNENIRPKEIELALFESSTPPTDTRTASKVKLTAHPNNSSISETCEIMVDNGQFLKFYITTPEDIDPSNNYWSTLNGVNPAGFDVSIVSDRKVSYISKAPITGDCKFDITVIYGDWNTTKPTITVETPQGANESPLFDSSTATLKESFKLNSANDWYYKFDTSTFDSSKYYYVKEFTPDGYRTNYITNGLKSGTIELENIKSELEVQKYWNDNNAEGHRAVTVDLYQTTQDPITEKPYKVTFEVYDPKGDLCYSYIDGIKANDTLKAELLIPCAKQWVGLDNIVGSVTQKSDTYVQNGEEGYICTKIVESNPITEDTIIKIRLRVDGTPINKPTIVNVTSSPSANNDPGIKLDDPRTTWLAEAVLDSSNDWYHKFEGINFKSEYKYYVVERDTEGYVANYLVNGISSGKLELVNQVVKSGSVKVDKSWLDNKEADEELEFEVVGYNSYAAQQKSQYSNSNAPSTNMYSAAEVTTPSNEEPVYRKTFTVSKNNDSWSGQVDKLPIEYNGKPVYYYIRELGSGTKYQAIDYSTNGFMLAENEVKTVKVINQKNESASYTLPETGGEGTEGYLITGGALMLGAALYYIIRKRKAAA